MADGNVRAAIRAPVFRLVAGQQAEFRFKNYREEWETRHVIIIGLDFGSNDYYPDQQWFVRCWDVERSEHRSFALNRIDVETLNLLTEAN